MLLFSDNLSLEVLVMVKQMMIQQPQVDMMPNVSGTNAQCHRVRDPRPGLISAHRWNTYLSIHTTEPPALSSCNLPSPDSTSNPLFECGPHSGHLFSSDSSIVVFGDSS
jgi:hypothetical protein